MGRASHTAPDGAKSDLYGPNPKGQVIYGPDGRYSIFFHRADMPKIAANNRTKKSKGASAETWTFAYDNRNQLVGVEERTTDGGGTLLLVSQRRGDFLPR